jgi:UDP-N-acetylmuramyl pentapeptide phosphotransferase/UDP-N-acetylglucosamine-1-phosphate transferase
MMNFLYTQPWLLFLALCMVLFLSSAVGYVLASGRRRNEDPHFHEQITALRDGLFIMLALLLGFALVMAQTRYEERKHLVVDEANAIGRTIFQAEMLPEPQRRTTLELLREYVTIRLDFAKVKLWDQSTFTRTIQRTKAFQEQLRQQVVPVAQQSQTAIIAGYIQTLSDMIDVSEKRRAKFEDRVPTTVWAIIILVGICHCFLAGYQLKKRFWLSFVITPLIVAAVTVLTFGLDDPHAGLSRIAQNSMERLANDVTSVKE